MTDPTKRRARRIASDEAHAWARNLRLGNAHAKYVLCMLTLYVNGDGRCFVSIPALADDCELAGETVRRRLAWLEEVGAITRVAQWIDDTGRRNSDGRGRRTSDEIMLCLETDTDEIEARCAGNAEADPQRQTGSHPDADPQRQTGSNPVAPPVGTPLAPSLRRGPESSEPEPEEDSPQPPKGGGQGIDQEFEEQIAEAQRAYPIPITNLPRFRQVWSAQEVAIRPKILTAMRGFAAFIADCERKNKPRAVKDADRWVGSGMWQGYIATGERAEAAAQVQRVAADSEAAKAVRVLRKIAHLSAPPEYGGMITLRKPLSKRGLAFAEAPPEREWVMIRPDQINQIGAYRELLNELGDIARPELVWDRNPKGERGFKAPWPWPRPPRKDDTLSTAPPDEAAA